MNNFIKTLSKIVCGVLLSSSLACTTSAVADATSSCPAQNTKAGCTTTQSGCTTGEWLEISNLPGMCVSPAPTKTPATSGQKNTIVSDYLLLPNGTVTGKIKEKSDTGSFVISTITYTFTPASGATLSYKFDTKKVKPNCNSGTVLDKSTSSCVDKSCKDGETLRTTIVGTSTVKKCCKTDKTYLTCGANSCTCSECPSGQKSYTYGTGASAIKQCCPTLTTQSLDCSSGTCTCSACKTGFVLAESGTIKKCCPLTKPTLICAGNSCTCKAATVGSGSGTGSGTAVQNVPGSSSQPKAECPSGSIAATSGTNKACCSTNTPTLDCSTGTCQCKAPVAVAGEAQTGGGVSGTPAVSQASETPAGGGENKTPANGESNKAAPADSTSGSTTESCPANTTLSEASDNTACCQSNYTINVNDCTNKKCQCTISDCSSLPETTLKSDPNGSGYTACCPPTTEFTFDKNKKPSCGCPADKPWSPFSELKGVCCPANSVATCGDSGCSCQACPTGAVSTISSGKAVCGCPTGTGWLARGSQGACCATNSILSFDATTSTYACSACSTDKTVSKDATTGNMACCQAGYVISPSTCGANGENCQCVESAETVSARQATEKAAAEQQAAADKAAAEQAAITQQAVAQTPVESLTCATGTTKLTDDQGRGACCATGYAINTQQCDATTKICKCTLSSCSDATQTLVTNKGYGICCPSADYTASCDDAGVCQCVAPAAQTPVESLTCGTGTTKLTDDQGRGACCATGYAINTQQCDAATKICQCTPTQAACATGKTLITNATTGYGGCCANNYTINTQTCNKKSGLCSCTINNCTNAVKKNLFTDSTTGWTACCEASSGSLSGCTAGNGGLCECPTTTPAAEATPTPVESLTCSGTATKVTSGEYGACCEANYGVNTKQCDATTKICKCTPTQAACATGTTLVTDATTGYGGCITSTISSKYSPNITSCDTSTGLCTSFVPTQASCATGKTVQTDATTGYGACCKDKYTVNTKTCATDGQNCKCTATSDACDTSIGQSLKIDSTSGYTACCKANYNINLQSCTAAGVCSCTISTCTAPKSLLTDSTTGWTACCSNSGSLSGCTKASAGTCVCP